MGVGSALGAGVAGGVASSREGLSSAAVGAGGRAASAGRGNTGGVTGAGVAQAASQALVSSVQSRKAERVGKALGNRDGKGPDYRDGRAPLYTAQFPTAQVPARLARRAWLSA